MAYKSLTLCKDADGTPCMLGQPADGSTPTIQADLYSAPASINAQVAAMLATGGAVVDHTTTDTAGTATGQATTGA